MQSRAKTASDQVSCEVHEPVAMDAGGKLAKLRGAVRAVQLTNALARDVTGHLADLIEGEGSSPVWIRTVFLLPFLWAAVDPLRFIQPRIVLKIRDASPLVLWRCRWRCTHFLLRSMC